MDTSTTLTDPVSAATQIPLTTINQLRPGHILTGPGWTSIRRVLSIEGDVISLIKLPAPAIPPNHTHTFTEFRNSQCGGCGLMRRLSADILPQEGYVRTFILDVTSPIIEPDDYTIYLTAGGVELRVDEGRGWQRIQQHRISQPNNNALPIIPTLLPVWTLPEELRRFVR